MDDKLDKEVPVVVTSKAKLVKHLDIDEKTFDEWLQGELFQDAFQELLQGCIKPEQAKVSTGQRPRGPSGAAVETAQ